MCEFEIPAVGVQQGWQCPICKRVYSPYVNECFYCGKEDVVTNINTEMDWSKFFKDYYTGGEMPKVHLYNKTIS